MQPRAYRNEITGILGERLKVKVTSAPVDGEANGALIKFLAKSFGLARGAVTLSSGERSKDKVVEVAGVNVAELTAILDSILK